MWTKVKTKPFSHIHRTLYIKVTKIKKKPLCDVCVFIYVCLHRIENFLCSIEILPFKRTIQTSSATHFLHKLLEYVVDHIYCVYYFEWMDGWGREDWMEKAKSIRAACIINYLQYFSFYSTESRAYHLFMYV